MHCISLLLQEAREQRRDTKHQFCSLQFVVQILLFRTEHGRHPELPLAGRSSLPVRTGSCLTRLAGFTARQSRSFCYEFLKPWAYWPKEFPYTVARRISYRIGSSFSDCLVSLHQFQTHSQKSDKCSFFIKIVSLTDGDICSCSIVGSEWIYAVGNTRYGPYCDCEQRAPVLFNLIDISETGFSYFMQYKYVMHVYCIK